jgi:proline iminopeptidase
MTDRHPVTEPYETGMLDVGDGHELYWETVGDPDGTPAVWLHGGPGGSSSVGTRGLFDPTAYRAVLLDQRGCGRSSAPRDPAHPDDPLLSDLAANTTDHLVADVERLREHLGVDRWVVAGGSWGVTLALVYAQRHPERVRALVLGAVTSGAADEIAWITRDVGRIWPREWDAFASLVPDADPADPYGIPAAYARLLADPDPAVRDRAAVAWCAWEDTHVSLAPGWQPFERFQDPAFRMPFARLVTHYWGHACFLEPDEVLRRTDRLEGIPGVLIHGRLDVSGPLETAWRLHHAWPGSELVVLEDAGHGGDVMTSAMVEALDASTGAP